MSSSSSAIRHQSLPDLAPEVGPDTAVVVTDEAGRLLVVNRTTCALLGRRRGEVLLLGEQGLWVAPATTAGIRAEVDAAGTASAEVSMRHHDGTAVPVHCDVTRVDLPDGPVYIWLARAERAKFRAVSSDPERRRIARALRLTERELEIVQLIADGLDNRSIAKELSVSLETVKTHIRRLFRKLAAKGRAHAVGIAWRMNLVD
jgi:DNA-binding CsgD family transcriptional regulator